MIETNKVHQLCQKLDQTARQYEARWGVGRLELMVSKNMRERWQRQCDKINEAIRANDAETLAALVEGSIRGYGALEAEALKYGHAPYPPDCMEGRHASGRIYRIVPTHAHAKNLPHLNDVFVYSLEEVVNILDAAQLINQPVKAHTHAPQKKAEPFDWSKGDEIPF